MFNCILMQRSPRWHIFRISGGNCRCSRNVWENKFQKYTIETIHQVLEEGAAALQAYCEVFESIKRKESSAENSRPWPSGARPWFKLQTRAHGRSAFWRVRLRRKNMWLCMPLVFCPGIPRTIRQSQPLQNGKCWPRLTPESSSEVWRWRRPQNKKSMGST